MKNVVPCKLKSAFLVKNYMTKMFGSVNGVEDVSQLVSVVRGAV